MKIPLVNGDVVLIDDADYPLIQGYAWRWKFARKGNRVKYAVAFYHNDTIRMHRIILGLANSTVRVDHKNRDGLDNRRENLRVATPSQNGGNRNRNANNTSGFKGVSLFRHLTQRPWHAAIRIKGTPIHLGCFANPVDAAEAYDQAARKYFGEFARTNF